MLQLDGAAVYKSQGKGWNNPSTIQTLKGRAPM